MQIQINAGHNIDVHEALAAKVSGVVENALSRISDQITRVEVHLSDEDGKKNGINDKRCMMEARLAGRQPVAVTDEAGTIDEAVEGAANKLARLIESDLDRLHDKKNHRTDLPVEGSKLTGQS
jgi:ribosome-associated translation inhibitor RaiA